LFADIKLIWPRPLDSHSPSKNTMATTEHCPMTNEPIEPPMEIKSRKGGRKVVADMMGTFARALTESEDTPVVGMLYLRFKTEAMGDEWCAIFNTAMAHLGLKTKVVSKEDDRRSFDVFVAKTDDELRTLANARFPGGGF
jgi:hypothetical protein